MIVAVWNPESGSAPGRDDLQASLGEGVRLIETTEDDPGPGQAAAARDEGATTVVACGGDGTVRACVSSLVGSETRLDIVPLGTGNLLAASLGIPAGLDDAGRAGHRPVRRIDVAIANGEPFVVMGGSGFDAHMIDDTGGEAKRRFGILAYVASAMRNLRNGMAITNVVVDGEQFFFGRTSMVLVGNHGTVSGGLTVFPDADPTDGRLDVAVLSADSIREWALVFWRLASGQAQDTAHVRRAAGAKVEVMTAKPRPYEIDGEARPPTNRVVFTVKPNALNVHYEPEEATNHAYAG